MVSTTMAKPVNLRHLSVAILVGLSTAGGAAHASAGPTGTSAPSTLQHQTSAVAAARQAAALLASDSLQGRLKALDVLGGCDAAMSPICRVDMGLAYARLAQDAQLDADTRAGYAVEARSRLRQAASLGNAQARDMLDSLDQAAHPSVGSRGAGPVAAEPAPPSPELVIESVPSEVAGHEAVVEELHMVRVQLEEANRTIALLRAQVAGQQASAFDAAAANRQALAAAMNGDYETAIPLFRKAAAANNSGAQNNLAVLYVNGSGVPRDLQQALTLFERAATLGNVESAENAARIYKYGIGRPRDPSRARAWYGRAVQLGSTSGADELDAMERAIAEGRYF
ncbi:tetratricopeptide repeat protein [Xanthomonas citri]|uniref:tetratricopeptide repeat protein n=2 Tax=Xanthomonas citri TaxID=346 RepID=UPI001F251EFC|nr:tetratricopeptide repeat protein [Xanthomonas citri]